MMKQKEVDGYGSLLVYIVLASHTLLLALSCLFYSSSSSSQSILCPHYLYHYLYHYCHNIGMIHLVNPMQVVWPDLVSIYHEEEEEEEEEERIVS
eukprot:scaffold3070_cov200-Ochromonas_danica.AAC.5